MDIVVFYNSSTGLPVSIAEFLFVLIPILLLLFCLSFYILDALFDVKYTSHVNYFKFRKSAKAFGFPKKITYSMYRDWYYKCYDPLIAKCYHDCFLNFLASKGDDSNA